MARGQYRRSGYERSGGSKLLALAAVGCVATFGIYNKDSLAQRFGDDQPATTSPSGTAVAPEIILDLTTSTLPQATLPPVETTLVPVVPAETTVASAPETTIAAPPPTETTLPAAVTVPAEQPASLVRPARVVTIGDSIGVLKDEWGDYLQLLEANGIAVLAHDEKGARPIVWGPCDTDATSLWCEGPAWDAKNKIGAGDGIRSLERFSVEVNDADAVQLDLGQNTFTRDLPAHLERMLRTAWDLSNQDGIPAAILVANMRHTNTSYVGAADDRNVEITKVVEKLQAEGMDIRILDVQSLQYQLDSGGIHPTALGAQQLAQGEAAMVIPIANELRDKNVALAAAA